MSLALLALAGLAGSGASLAAPQTDREPARYPEIQRELRIGADVLGAALGDALPAALRVVDVEAGYLAGQGVLVIVDLEKPWFRMDGTDVDIDPDLTSLEQIPDMVHDILSELNLGLSPHQVQDLQELREVRDAQRRVRAEQRALRGQLRELKRQRLRADEPEAVDRLDREIAALEADLAAAQEEERALEQDALTVKNTLRDSAPSPATTSAESSIDQAVALAVCGYGDSFRSLAGNERLNVLIRRADGTRYYVFAMDAVRTCQPGDQTAQTLLENAFRYESTSTSWR